MINIKFQTLKEKAALLAMLGVSTFAGAAGGVTLFNAFAAHAQSSSPSVVTAQTAPAVSSAPSSAPSMDQGGKNSNGTFKSNEDPAHEAKESAAREAQENAGQRPTVP